MRVHEMIQLFYPQYYSIETYPAERTIRIHKIDEEWGVFSNFAHTPVEVNGVSFDTTERLLQVMKMATPEAEKMVYEKKGNPKMTAKHIQKEHPEWIREDWPRIIVDAMKFCLRTKYEQCEMFRNELERSKGFYIVEDQTSFPKRNADTWGAKLVGEQYVGPNLLGRLLMELREQKHLDYTFPPVFSISIASSSI